MFANVRPRSLGKPLIAALLLLLISALVAAACGNDGGDPVVGNAATAQAEQADEDEQAHEDEPAHEDQDGLDEAAARTIQVVMTEFAFEPDVIRVREGETIRLVFRNAGSILHDTSEQFVGHVQARETAEHEHEQAVVPFHGAAEAAAAGEFLFVATEAGEFDLFCSVPGHRELGMVATLIVEES